MHHHNHTHTISPNQNIKILWLSVILTAGFAVVEAITGYFSHSLALLGDAGHMAADSLTLIMAAVAAWIAERPPSSRHTYGLGRAEVVCALISSVFIILIAVALAVEAVHRLQTPEPIAGGTVMLVASGGILINILVAVILSRAQQTLNMRAAVLHVLSDLLGSIAALLSGAIIYFTHWHPIDAILTIFICVLILLSSLRLLRDTLLVLMEGVPAHLTITDVGKSMANIDMVLAVHDLHIWTLSSGTILLSAHVQIKQIEQWQPIFETISRMLKHRYDIEHVTLQPEVVPTEVIHRMPFPDDRKLKPGNSSPG